MNNVDLDMYSDPKYAVPTVPQEMRICEINYVILRPDVAYIFTVDPNCKGCVKYASAYADEVVEDTKLIKN